MHRTTAEMEEVKQILDAKHSELVHGLNNREGITIEKSADQMDEIQYATERDLAVHNVDRDSRLLRQVKAALKRLEDGSFGECIECELEISPKRIAAVPWAARCIQCQEIADRKGAGRNEEGEDLTDAA